MHAAIVPKIARSPHAAGWFLALTLATAGATAHAADTVRTLKATLNGKVTATSAEEVTLDRGEGRIEKIPVNEIRFVRFEGEPPKLDQARRSAQAGRYEQCLKTLADVDLAQIERPEIKLDVEFYRLLSSGRLALAGVGNPREAGKQVLAFTHANANSFHALEATLLLGDLLAAVGAYDKALSEYGKIERLTWPDYKMRGGLARAGVLRRQGEFADARAAYDAVLALAGEDAGELVSAQRLTATLGKAECLSEEGQADEAVKLIEQVIARANAEDEPLHAQAYNALGLCHKKAGRTKDALLAFLHVDVLYFSQVEAHGTALQNLVELWNAVNQPERAQQALEVLESRKAAATTR